MRDENAYIYRRLPAACLFCVLPECSSQLTTATWFIASLTHCCIYCIHCRNYELINQTEGAEWMKSSDTVALIMPIRFLPSSYILLHLSRVSCGQWPSNDGQIITLHRGCQVSCLFTLQTRKQGRRLKERKTEKRKTKMSIYHRC